MQALTQLTHRWKSLYVLIANAVIIGTLELKTSLLGAGKNLENRLNLAEF